MPPVPAQQNSRGIQAHERLHAWLLPVLVGWIVLCALRKNQKVLHHFFNRQTSLFFHFFCASLVVGLKEPRLHEISTCRRG